MTLWVFSLNVGDDCEGTPLPVEALAAETKTPTDAPVATAAASPATRTTSSTSSPPPVAERAEAPGEATSRALTEAAESGAQPADPSGTGATPPVTPPAVAATASPDASNEIPAAAASSTQPSREPAERPAAPDPLATAAVAPATTARSAPAEIAATGSLSTAGAAAGATPAEAPALAAPATLVAAVDDEAAPPAGEAVAPELVITFDVNSSFFPAGAGPQLRAFLDRLPDAEPVQLELAAAVGSGAVRGASAEEAERYNAWMAERRVQRVTEWLEANARDRPITVTERLVENDPSREVRLHATLDR